MFMVEGFGIPIGVFKVSELNKFTSTGSTSMRNWKITPFKNGIYLLIVPIYVSGH